MRGAHAHKPLRQFSSCVDGAFSERETIRLDRAAGGLYIPLLIWDEEIGFSPCGIGLVLASQSLDESDDLRDNGPFLATRQQTGQVWSETEPRLSRRQRGWVMNSNRVIPGLVKIIITSYNRSHYLKLAVASALAQTYANYHIIIVDDASPDDSGAVAREYMAHYPEKITAICKDKRLGPVDSINQAFALCHDAAYVAFHPDDDLWLPHKLQRQIACFAKQPELGLVCSDATLIDSEGRPTGRTFAERSGTFDKRNVAARILLSGNFICASSAVVSHEALALLGFHVPAKFRFMNDEYMWLIISSVFGVQYIAEPLTLYRVTSGAASAKYLHETHQEEFELLLYAYNHYPGIRSLTSAQQFEDRLMIMAMAYAQTNLRVGQFREYLWFVHRAWRFRPRRATVRLMAATTIDTVAPRLLRVIRQWQKHH